ncbi:hypothetical protein RJ641_027396 [Dillenia turbinata]|uniref:Uncharacterized protein n=1 Tax=Dillenia turbinata TaxID=194707 RepID=A0AAN8W2D8_9MAGN
MPFIGNETHFGDFSLGLNLGFSRTGVALSKGLQKLELKLVDIAKQEEVDEFIIGIPKSFDGKQAP